MFVVSIFKNEIPVKPVNLFRSDNHHELEEGLCCNQTSLTLFPLLKMLEMSARHCVNHRPFRGNWCPLWDIVFHKGFRNSLLS